MTIISVANRIHMAYVTPACFDSLRLYDPRQGNKSSDDSDIVFVSDNTGKKLFFSPVDAEVAQVLCTKLEVQCKKQFIFRLPGEIGAPCKNVKIKGDGNCFFRAFSEALCGTDAYHGKIRSAVVQQLESKDATYRSMLTKGYASVSEYIDKSKISFLGSWATELEIQTVADYLGVSIYTYYTNRWLEYSCKGLQVSEHGIYLENCGNHYETVVCVKMPGMQLCYGYCKEHASGSITPQTREYTASNLSDSESAWQATMANDYNYWMCDDEDDDDDGNWLDDVYADEEIDEDEEND